MRVVGQLRGVVVVLVAWFSLLLPRGADAFENWTIFDLGASRTEAICLQAGQDAMLSFARTFGMRRVDVGARTIFGYGLAKSGHDGVIICSSGVPRTQAILVIYSDNTIMAKQFAQRISDEFAERNKTLQAEWLAAKLRESGF